MNNTAAITLLNTLIADCQQANREQGQKLYAWARDFLAAGGRDDNQAAHLHRNFRGYLRFADLSDCEYEMITAILHHFSRRVRGGRSKG